MNEIFMRYGKELAATTFNSRDFSEIANLLNDATSNDAGRQKSGGQLFGVVVAEFARFIEDARAKGVRFTQEPATVNALAYLSATSPVDYLNAAKHVLHTIKELVRAQPEIKVIRREAAKPEPSAAKPDPSEPIAVRIVSTPPRKTQTIIDRDEETMEVRSMTYIGEDC